jgi:cbb3-type cytochrome oxidase maturation protein
MGDFFYLIPISVLLGAAGLAIFLWTLRDGQYDDLDGASQRILYEEDEPRREPAKTDSSAPPPPDEPLL